MNNNDSFSNNKDSFSFKRWKPKVKDASNRNRGISDTAIRHTRTPVSIPAPMNVSGLSYQVPKHAPTSSSTQNGFAITRVHWQADMPDDICHEKNCTRTFGILGRRHHCRRCGKIYCKSHLLHHMKLSAQASYDPDYGMLVPVCRSCHATTEKYIDHQGSMRDLTPMFLLRRRHAVNKLNEKSSKLIEVLNSIQENKDPKGLVDWAPDASAIVCRLCGSEFSLLRRRHHCRLCGHIYCSSKACSAYLSLENGSAVRACSPCTQIVERDLFEKPVGNVKLSSLYMALCLKRNELEESMFDYRSRVTALSDGENLSQTDVEELERSKKSVMQNFNEFQTLGTTIERLPANTPATQRLQQSINRYASLFLQTAKVEHMRDLTIASGGTISD